jgi:hypothetical protein
MDKPRKMNQWNIFSTFLLIIVFINLSCNLTQVTIRASTTPNASSFEDRQGSEEAYFNPTTSIAPASTLNPTSTYESRLGSTDRPTAQTSVEVLASATPVDNIDTLLTSCPSEAELERFNSDFHILFDQTISYPPYDCHNGTGPNGEVNPKLALFQGLRVIHALHFTQPLPWTETNLYEWLKAAINGIVITDTEFSHCCDMSMWISLKADLLNQPDYRLWINPQSGSGLIGLIGLIVHEARHAEIGGHTCGNDDQTLEELGAWGIQYYLFQYMAEYTPSDFFTQEQRQMAINHANIALSRICYP